VALPIALALTAPLALLWVRKIGAPSCPELALGCVADGDPPEFVWNEDVLANTGVSEEDRRLAADQALRELMTRKARFPAGPGATAARGCDVILVDDGIATGATMRAAIEATRRHAPSSIIVGTPVAAPEVVADLRARADEVVCLVAPERLGSVGAAYANFAQVTDGEVHAILAQAARP
jgi:putative phosphoribosyl transferase